MREREKRVDVALTRFNAAVNATLILSKPRVQLLLNLFLHITAVDAAAAGGLQWLPLEDAIADCILSVRLSCVYH